MSTPDPATDAAPETSASGSPSPGPGKAPPQVVRRRHSGGLIAVVLLVILVVAGIGGAYELHYGPFAKSTPEADCSTGLTLNGEGAAFVNSLVTAWGSSYQGSTSNQVNYDGAGTGAGITQFTDQLVDFAATDEPLNSSEANALPGPALTLPITGGALTVLYNLPGFTGETTPLKLSGPVLADIYDGQITMWNDPRIQNNNTGVTLPPDPITVVYRTDSAGLSFVLTTLLSDVSPTWKAQFGVSLSMPKPPSPAKVLGASGNTHMLDDVETTSYAIGYSDLSDTLSAQGTSAGANLQYASVLNPAGNYILPSEATAAAAIEHISANTTFPSATQTSSWVGINMVDAPGVNDYPLSTLAYFFVYLEESSTAGSSVGYTPSEIRDQVIHQWLNWVLTTGQSQAVSYDFVPLSSQLVSLDQTGLSQMTFNGASLAACK